MAETLTEMAWPMNGLWQSSAFGDQPPGTTPTGINVRTYEPSLMRARGGARNGLSQYIPAQAAGVPALIQHLNYIVDPTVDALLSDSGPNLVPYPGFPGQFVRVGGSGVQPNKNKSSASNIKFIQKGSITGSVGGFFNPNVTSQTLLGVSVGDLLIAFVSLIGTGNLLTGPGTGNVVTSITDTLGNTYTQISTYATVTADVTGNEMNISAWYAFSKAAGDNTLQIRADNSISQGGADGWFLEYAGVNQVGSVDGFSTSTQSLSSPGPFSWSTGAVFVGNLKDMLLGTFAISGVVSGVSFPTKFISRGGSSIGVLLGERIGVPAGGIIGNQPVTATGTIATSTAMAAFGVSFKST